jgi:hypothetical protein
MVAVRVVKMAVDEVVRVVSVRNPGVTTGGVVLVIGVLGGAVTGRAVVGICRAD